MTTNDQTMTLADIVARIGLANTDHVVASLRLVGEIRQGVSVKDLENIARDAGMASPTTCARGWTLLAKVSHLALLVADEDGDPTGLPSWETIVRNAASVYNDKPTRARFESQEYADISDMVGTLADYAVEAREASRTRQADAKAKAQAKTPKKGATPPPAPGTRTLAATVGDVTADLARILARIESGETVDTLTLAAVKAMHQAARDVATATLAARAVAS